MVAARTVDVLIPHHDDVEGLALSLRSVAAQTVSDVRVVVADDGSGDEAFAAVEALLEASGLDAHLIRNARNLGRPRTRNVLLDAIESPLVAWLDAGDEWYPEKLERQIAALDRLDPDLPPSRTWITCNYDWRWTGRPAIACAQVTDQDQRRAILLGRNLRAYLWTLLAPAGAFRAVGYFDEHLPRLQDVDFFLRFLAGGGTIAHCGDDRPLCQYHKSDAGRDAVQIRDCNAYLLRKHPGIYGAYGDEFMRSCMFEMDLLSARYAVNNGQWLLAGRFAGAALRKRPRTLASRLLGRAVRSIHKRGRS